MKQEDIVVAFINISHEHAIGLNAKNDLIVYPYHKPSEQMNLGPLTQTRAKELSEYLQRLAIHTPLR